MKPINIALVDDHVLFGKGIAALNEDDECAHVIFEA